MSDHIPSDDLNSLPFDFNLAYNNLMRTQLQTTNAVPPAIQFANAYGFNPNASTSAMIPSLSLSNPSQLSQSIPFQSGFDINTLLAGTSIAPPPAYPFSLSTMLPPNVYSSYTPYGYPLLPTGVPTSANSDPICSQPNHENIFKNIKSEVPNEDSLVSESQNGVNSQSAVRIRIKPEPMNNEEKICSAGQYCLDGLYVRRTMNNLNMTRCPRCNKFYHNICIHMKQERIAITKGRFFCCSLGPLNPTQNAIDMLSGVVYRQWHEREEQRRRNRKPKNIKREEASRPSMESPASQHQLPPQDLQADSTQEVAGETPPYPIISVLPPGRSIERPIPIRPQQFGHSHAYFLPQHPTLHNSAFSAYARPVAPFSESTHPRMEQAEAGDGEVSFGSSTNSDVPSVAPPPKTPTGVNRDTETPEADQKKKKVAKMTEAHSVSLESPPALSTEDATPSTSQRDVPETPEMVSTPMEHNEIAAPPFSENQKDFLNWSTYETQKLAGVRSAESSSSTNAVQIHDSGNDECILRFPAVPDFSGIADDSDPEATDSEEEVAEFYGPCAFEEQCRQDICPDIELNWVACGSCSKYYHTFCMWNDNFAFPRRAPWYCCGPNAEKDVMDYIGVLTRQTNNNKKKD